MTENETPTPPNLPLTPPRMVLALLSGLLLTAGFPKLGFFWLAWVALVPFLLALNNLSPRNGFRLGFLTGIVHYLTLLYWIVYTMKTYGGLPLWICVPVLLLMAAYLSLFPATLGFLAARFCPTPLAGLVLVPIMWVLLEYLRAYLFSGFPWALLGHSQFPFLRLIQIADLFGVYALSFLIATTNTALTLGLLFWKNRKWYRQQASQKFIYGSFGAVAGLILIACVYGSFRIGRVDKMAAAAPELPVAVIQGNIDQAAKWDPVYQISTTKKYLRLSQSSPRAHERLIIWPETALPFYFSHNRQLTQLVQKGIQRSGADYLIGSPSFTRRSERLDYYNSAFLVQSDGTVAGRYDKSHLVPFGEYVPFQSLLPFISRLVEGVGDFNPGERGRTLTYRDFQLGPQICYEIIFARLARALVKNQARVLINMTNDAWYGRTSAPHQFFSMAIFRAVETRRALVRAANTGISGIIDPAGRIVHKSNIFEDAVIATSVPLISHMSFYVVWGDLFVWLCLVVFLVWIVMFNPKDIRPFAKRWPKGHDVP